MAAKTLSPMRAIRLHCLDCCSNNSKLVAYCSCDGIHGTYCHLWVMRFGKKPATAAKLWGAMFLDPEQMPDDVPLSELPTPAAKRPEPTEEGRRMMAERMGKTNRSAGG